MWGLGRWAGDECTPPGVVVTSLPMAEERSETSDDGGSRSLVDEAGVDLTLIRAYLALTPIERLRALQNMMRAIGKFRPMVRSK